MSGASFHVSGCEHPDTFFDVDRFRCRGCDWQTTPRDPARCIAAVCSCGGAVFHESTIVVEGFIADHTPGRRPGCDRVETGTDLDEVRARFATAEQLGVLFL